jgi:hypothetical protein
VPRRSSRPRRPTACQPKHGRVSRPCSRPAVPSQPAIPAGETRLRAWVGREHPACGIIPGSWARSSMAEQLTLNQRVEGSSPSGLTKFSRTKRAPNADPRAVLIPVIAHAATPCAVDAAFGGSLQGSRGVRTVCGGTRRANERTLQLARPYATSCFPPNGEAHAEGLAHWLCLPTLGADPWLCADSVKTGAQDAAAVPDKEGTSGAAVTPGDSDVSCSTEVLEGRNGRPGESLGPSQNRRAVA